MVLFLMVKEVTNVSFRFLENLGNCTNDPDSLADCFLNSVSILHFTLILMVFLKTVGSHVRGLNLKICNLESFKNCILRSF